MKRLSDWRIRYEQQINEIRSVKFNWGSHDCLSGLVAPITQAITGVDAFVQFRGKYKTAKGALSVMRRAGFSNLAELVGNEFVQAPVAQSQIGDIAAIVVDDGFGYSLGIVNGDCIFVITPNGIETRDLMVAEMIFKVG